MWQQVAPGRRIGQYELLEEIGRGGSAVVFKAFDAGRRRAVAVKVIAAGFAADETFRARFRQEAQLITRLRHPHILAVVDSGETGARERSLPPGMAYLITDYLAGGNLADALDDARCMQERCQCALAVAEQIGDALDWAHESGVLHRDVKPSNVLLDGAGSFVLSDFGLARVLHNGSSLHLTITGQVAGTPAYMAPEQALGEPADARTDLYGLAVVLYEVITGRVPFEAETPLATMLAHVHQPPPRPQQVEPATPEPVERVLLRALSKSRDERYQSGAALASALRAAVVAAYGEACVATGLSLRVDGGRSGVVARSPAAMRSSAALAARRGRTPRVRGLPPGQSGPRRGLRNAALAAVTVSGLALAGTAGLALALGPARPVIAPLVAPALAGIVARYTADAGPPRVTQAVLVNNEHNPSLRPSVSLVFSHKMDQESVERALHLEPPAPLDFEWDEQLLVVTPQANLAPAMVYQLIMEPTAADIEGRPLAAGRSWQLSTMALAEPPKQNVGLAAPLPVEGNH